MKVANVDLDNKKLILSITVPILIVMIIILYKNTLSRREINKMIELDYKDKLSLKNIQSCDELEAIYQFKLNDYYISSSYMTPCIGNLHYDYVSMEMIETVINSGARFIMIPICQEGVEYESKPVIATAEYGKKIITSLNTINVNEVFRLINKIAFIYDNKTLNYPLFIKLILHTKNKYVLNELYQSLISSFNKNILLPDKYHKYPIGLEKLCKLLNKIVIFSTVEYKNTDLEKIVVPTDKLFNEYHYGQLGEFNIQPEEYHTNEYNKLLSEKEQERSHQYFVNNFKDLNNMLNLHTKPIDSENISEEEENDESNAGILHSLIQQKNIDSNQNLAIKNRILNDKYILDNLSTYNKIALTQVNPNESADTLSSNYEFMESFKYGCQFVTMNFQNNDQYMKRYINIFKESSFKLKPDSLRFENLQLEIPDISKQYSAKPEIGDDIPTIPNFVKNYNYSLVSIESITNSNLFLTSNESNLSFNAPLNNSKLSKNQVFVIKKSDLLGDFDSIYINSITNNKYYVSLNDNQKQFILKQKNKSPDGRKQQAFYPINSANKDKNLISLQCVDSSNKLLSFYRKLVLASVYVPDKEGQDNMSFKINKVNHRQTIKFVSLTGYGLKSYKNGNVNLVKKPISDLTMYSIISQDPNNNKFINNSIYLKNEKSGKYLYTDSTGQLIENNFKKNSRNSLFEIKEDRGFYILRSALNRILTYKKNEIQFVDPNRGKSTNMLFKIQLDYTIL